MWSETVDLGQDRSQSNEIGLGLGLAGLALCCETRSCYARRYIYRKGHNNMFQVGYDLQFLCSVLGSGDQQWRLLT